MYFHAINFLKLCINRVNINKNKISKPDNTYHIVVGPLTAMTILLYGHASMNVYIILYRLLIVTLLLFAVAYRKVYYYWFYYYYYAIRVFEFND